jgi:hypothetical protein
VAEDKRKREGGEDMSNGDQLPLEAEPKDIVPVTPGLPSEGALDRAEKRDALMRRVMQLAITATNESDYSMLGQNLWIEATGVEKIARRFGITFGRPTITKEYHDDKDGKRFYTMVCEGEIFMSDVDRIWAIGTADSNDQFLTQDHKNEADVNDIRKKAWSNWEVNGVTRLLGIRGITTDDLKAGHLNPQLIRGVKFRSKEETPVGNGGTTGITGLEMRRQIGEALTAEFGEDEDAAKTKLRLVTEFKGNDGKMVLGIEDVAMLSGKRLEIAHAKICKGRK